MSADKDRGIRRQKQKRAKEMKRTNRLRHLPTGTDNKPVPKAAEQPAV